MTWNPYHYLFKFCLLIIPSFLHGQGVAEQVYSIDKTIDIYEGPGVEWLLNKARDKDYLLFGEQHGVSEIPPFVSYCYQQLQETGFDHLILEIDPITSQLITDMGLAPFIRQYPHSIAFDYDGELVLIQNALESHPDRQIIWGMDQIITAIHPFRILENMAQTAGIKRICRGLSLKATLKTGAYLRQDHQSDLKVLKTLFQKNNNKPALKIVDQLITSQEIYLTYLAGKRGEISPRVSVTKRENYMISNFDAFLQLAPAPTKGIIKMGGTHTAYGIGPNGIPTLGGHIRDLARKEDKDVLSIGIFNYDAEDNFLPDSLFMQHTAILLDNQSIIDQIDSTTLRRFPDSFQKNLTYFDAMIYFNRAPPSSKNIITTQEGYFRRQALVILTIGLLLILINLSIIIPIARIYAHRRLKNDHIQYPIRPFINMLGLSLLIDALLITQLTSFAFGIPRQSTVPFPPDMSLALYALLLLLSTWSLLHFWSTSKKGKWDRSLRLHFGLIGLNNTLLIAYLYYWNIGGMFN